jgi:hypothetical protein
MDIPLIAGLWLDGPVWDNVAAHLEGRGHRAVPVSLPGQGDGNTSAMLADQATAVVAAVDAAAGRPMVVGHSAACTLAWLAADARPRQDQQSRPHRRLPLSGRRDILRRLLLSGRRDALPGLGRVPRAGQQSVSFLDIDSVTGP